MSLAASIFTLLHPVFASEVHPLEINKDKLATSIKEAFIKSNFNGYVVVSKNGKELFSGGSGSINTTSDIKIDENTVFGIASITKPLTATGIALLEQRGTINYADTIDKYIENVPIDKKQITIHQLLTHTAGIVDGVASDTEHLEKQELLNRILTSKLTSAPGSKFEYSNAGYSLLAAIIDNVSGKSYANFMREEIFQPLSMKNTGSTGMPFFKNLNVTNGYYNGKDYGKLSDYPLSWNGLIGNGDILSTSKDMHNMFKNLFSGKLLTEENLDKMQKPYVRESEESNYYYGYGWDIVMDDVHGKIISHNGGGMSGNHIVTYYEKYDLCVLVFNTRIEDRLLFNDLPYYVDYPADQLSEAIISNIFTGTYDKLPSVSLPLWRSIAIFVGIICIIVGGAFTMMILIKRKIRRIKY